MVPGKTCVTVPVNSIGSSSATRDLPGISSHALPSALAERFTHECCGRTPAFPLALKLRGAPPKIKEVPPRKN
jgi:hypothetical protein